MSHFKSILAVAAIALAMASCRTPKNITYIQDLNPGQAVQVAPSKAITAQPGDRVSIVVHSKDPQLAQIFNLSAARSNTTGVGGQTASRGVSGNNQLMAYTVDSFGDIEFPVLGPIHIGDMTRQQIAKLIKDELIERQLLKDPTVIVEFLDHYVTVLGAVNNPGLRYFDRDNLNLIDAIGLAGDLNISGMRKNVKVVRMENGKERAYEVDLTDAKSLYQSPAFYIQPNDFIYVEPNNTTKRNTTPMGNSPFTPTFWMSLASFATSMTLLFIKL